MAGYNRVILVGNLTRDPQLKYLPSNTAVCEFGLAMSRRWRDRDGNQQEDVCFVDVSAFGRPGETINQYMSKGKPILIEGRLRYDSWTTQDGSKRSKLSVVVENFQFLGSRDGGGGGGGGYAQQQGGSDHAGGGGYRSPNAPQSRDAGGYAQHQAPPEEHYPQHEPPTGDDIPF